MKKILSVFLAALMLCAAPISAFAMSNAKFDWEPASTDYDKLTRGDDVVARIVVGSDVHIGYYYASPKLENAYKAIGKLGGADAFILAGDLTDLGTDAQFDELVRIMAENTKNLTVDVDGFTLKGAGDKAPIDTTLLLMGNHDFATGTLKESEARFTGKTGQALDKLYWIADKVPVIKVSMTSGSYKDNYVTKHDFIKDSLDEIDATGYKGHIFFVTHMATGGTVAGAPGANDEPFDPKTIELLAKYPQVIHVSGHSHQIINNPTIIDQSAGFTSITDGVVGEDYSENVERLGSGVIIFDVMNNGKTKIHRLDLENAELLYPDEEFILDSSDTAEDFKYFANLNNAKNPDSYGLSAKAPTLPSDAWVKYEINGDHDSVDISFTANAQAASDMCCDYVSYYRVTATPADGQGAVIGGTVTNDVYKPKDKREDVYTTTLRSLDWNRDYIITVQAFNAYGMASNTVTAEGFANVGMPEFQKAHLLYDVDASYGKMNDAMGHATTLAKAVKSVYDEEIGQSAMEFQHFQTNRYEFGQDELDAIRHQLTLETYFKAVNTEEKQAIVSMLYSAGIEIYIENGNLEVLFGTLNASGKVAATVPVNANEWTHVTLTYDDKELRVYVNGKEAAVSRRSGGLTMDLSIDPVENSFLINVGGRDKAEPDAFLMERGSLINCFRLYSGRMTAEEVRAAYERTTKPNVTLPFADVAEDAWYADTVRYAYENALMNGTSDTAFAPATATSRAMIVQLLYNMEGRPAVEYKPIFTDVKEDAWYADAVIWAYENGVTTGSSATTFSPDALVTREQVAVFLYRFMKDYKGEDMAEGADISAFPDHDKISPYAGFAEAVAWANGVGIITGKTSSDGAILAPLDNAQRCETATMFARFHRSFVA